MSGGEARLEELIAQYFAEKERAGELDVEAFAARHPEHAEELRDVLQGMELMERAAEAFSAEDALQALDTLAALGKARRRLGSGRSMGGDGRGEEKRPVRDDFVTRVLEDLESQGISSRRYAPEGEIARGGQGAVFAVRDETLRRTLAMKVALASAGEKCGSIPSDARSLGRFLEEAQVTAQLDHPGIVPVHELGLDRERRVYFTMKLVKGRALRVIFELVRRNEEDWTLTRTLSVLLKVCEAMAYAHSKRVIHRDLKPSNVMVGKFGEVYVMDWGLARVLGGEDRKDIRIRPAMTSELTSPRHDAGDDLDSPLVTMDGEAARRAGYSLWSDIRDWPELDDGYPNHAPVNRFAANPFGFHCVHGNLWELCLDGFEYGGRPASGVDPVVDPLPTSSRIVRGGGFAYGAFHARSAMRTDAAPTYDAPWVGVRPARKITGEIRYTR